MYQQAVGGQPSSEVRFSTEESQRFTRQSSRGQTQQARLPIQEQQPQVRPVSSLEATGMSWPVEAEDDARPRQDQQYQLPYQREHDNQAHGARHSLDGTLSDHLF